MYNIKSTDLKLVILCVLILCFIMIICKNITNTSIEGMGVPDISQITSTVSNIARDAGSIPGKITDLGSTIANATSGITNIVTTKISEAEAKIETKIQKKIDLVKETIKTELIDPIKSEVSEAKDKIKDIFKQLAGIPQLIIDKIEKKVEWLLTKIKRFGENIGDLIKGGIVKPFMTLFQAMGHMFVTTGKIAMKVIGKIKSLPNCSILYVFQAVAATVETVYKWILPGFLRDIISTIYKYTLQTPLEYLSCLVGLTAWWHKCLSFNVDDETNSIIKKFNEVGPAFKKTFGHMDFKELFDLSKDKEDEKARVEKETDKKAEADEKADLAEEASLLAQQMIDDSFIANKCNKIVSSKFT